jgi:uncharacterized protein YjbI with pentapeptide repeats
MNYGIKLLKYVGFVILFILALNRFPEKVVAQEKSIKINKENFPDEDFRNNFVRKYDKNKDRYLTRRERNQAKVLDYYSDDSGIWGFHSSTNISINGIEYFPNIEKIEMQNKVLKNVNVSKNRKLKELVLFNCEIRNINVCNNKKLKKISIVEWDPMLKSIDLSKNMELETLSIDGVFKELDTSKCLLLKELSVTNNYLETLNLNRNINLEELVIHGDKIKNIKLRKNKELRDLLINGKRINKINLVNNVKLEAIQLTRCNLKSLKLPHHAEKLKRLYCNRNRLKTLDISMCPILSDILCNNNKLRKLILPNDCWQITRLSCYKNNLSYIVAKGIDPDTVKKDEKTSIRY